VHRPPEEVLMKRRRSCHAASSKPHPDRARLLMATVDTLPEPYDVVGVVHASTAVAVGTFPVDHLLDALEAQAASLGADGVIGIRISEIVLPGISRTRMTGQITDHSGGMVVATALGTAVLRQGDGCRS
jgi:hypothetical protein